MDALNIAVENEKNDNASFFDGDVLTKVILNVLSKIVGVVTLNICTPFVLCRRLQWQAAHTYLSGRRLVFDGKSKELFLKNLLWSFLCVVTVGIFIPFKAYKSIKWQTEHTHFYGVPNTGKEENESKFDGKILPYVGVNIAAFFATVFSLGIAYFWAFNYKERKITGYKIIDGHRLEFTGSGVNYFAKRLSWAFLTVITLGVYSLLINGKLFRWKISCTKVNEPQTIPFDEDTAKSQA